MLIPANSGLAPAQLQELAASAVLEITAELDAGSYGPTIGGNSGWSQVRLLRTHRCRAAKVAEITAARAVSSTY